MEQVGAVRKRWLVDEFSKGRRTGAIWALHTRLEDFPLSDRCGYEPSVSAAIQRIRTDLDSFSDAEIACLENHGYSLADASLRSRATTLCENPHANFRWPHPAWTEQSVILPALANSHSYKVLRSLGKFAKNCFWRKRDKD